MCSLHIEVKSVVAERFIRTLKNKIYKHMTAVSKNIYLDVLDDIFDKHNNTYHRRIKLKPIDVKSDSYAKYKVDSNDPKFKIGDHIRISNSKNNFAKGYAPNSSKEVFVIFKLKITVLWTYLISDPNGEEIVETLYEKELR